MRARPLTRLARLVAAPLAAWLLATALVLTTAALAGFDPFRADTWIRWDASLYLQISRDGYTLFRCSNGAPDAWCGNAGWFPAYPWLVGFGDRIGLPLAGTAVGISWSLSLGTLVLMWATFLEERLSVESAGALLYAAFAPGAIYGYAAFPISMLAFSTIACLWFLYCNRWLAAGLAAAVCAITYPVGVVLALTGALWPLVARSDLDRGARLRASGIVSGLGAAGLAVVALVQQVQADAWNAYLLVQDKYGHELQSPTAAAGDAIATIARHWPPLLSQSGPALQTLLVTAVLVASLIAIWLSRRTLAQVDLLVVMWVLPAWVLANVESNVSIYRSEATLVPLALLVRRLPRPLLAGAVAAAALLLVVMTKLFVESTLV